MFHKLGKASAQPGASPITAAVVSHKCRLCHKSGCMDVTDATFDLTGESHQLSSAYQTFASLAIGCEFEELRLDSLRICFACTNELVAAFTFLAKVSVAEQRLGTLPTTPKQRKHSDGLLEPAEADDETESGAEVPATVVDVKSSPVTVADNEQTQLTEDADTSSLDAGIIEHDFKQMAENDEGDIYDTANEDAANVYHDHHIDDGSGIEPNATHSSSGYEIVEYIVDEDDHADVDPSHSPDPQAAVAAAPNRKRVAAAAANVSPKSAAAAKRACKAAKRPNHHITVDLHHVLIPQFLIGILDPASRPEVIPQSGLPANAFGVTPTLKTVDVSVRRCSAFGPAGLQLRDGCANQADHPNNDNSVYMCSYCPKAFTTAPHLLVHTRKNHVCQFCLGSFDLVADMHTHIRQLHHGHFPCPLCDRYFNSNSNLRNHLRGNHDLQLPPGWSVLSDTEVDPELVRLCEDEEKMVEEKIVDEAEVEGDDDLVEEDELEELAEHE